MSKLSADLTKVRAVLFDVDGVLSGQTIALGEDGTPIRTVNVHDGYAIRQAVKCGLELGIISGGHSPSIPKRYAPLGMKHIYMEVGNKLEALADFVQKTGIEPEEIVFCGDDIPDIKVMQRVGLAVAPKDASPEVKAVAHYISPIRGGEGVARDILKEILSATNRWMHNDEAFIW